MVSAVERLQLAPAPAERDRRRPALRSAKIAPVTTILVAASAGVARDALHAALRVGGFSVRDVEPGRLADEVAHHPTEVAVIDMSRAHALDLVTAIRRRTPVPLVAIGSTAAPWTVVDALDAGADDYVAYPFDTAELLARVRAALRRPTLAPVAGATARCDSDLEIDLAAREVRRAGRPVHLTRTELDLLAALVTHAGKLLRHDWLLREVWGPSYGTESQYLRVFIGQLRRKLGDDAHRPRLIRTEPGQGYRWIA